MNKVIKSSLWKSALILPIGAFILPTVVSCSSNANTNDSTKDFQEIKKYLEENKNKTIFAKPASAKELKGVKTIENDNKNFDDFKKSVLEYLTISDSAFNDLLTKDDYRIFKSIQKVIISPQLNSKNVKVFLFNKNDDQNQVSVEIKDYLTKEFSYEETNTIKIKVIESPKILATQEEFQTKLKNLKEKQDLELIKVGFDLSGTKAAAATTEEDKLKKHLKDDIEIIEEPNFKITLKWKPAALEKGLIFNVNDSYQGEVSSYSLAKEK